MDVVTYPDIWAADLEQEQAWQAALQMQLDCAAFASYPGFMVCDTAILDELATMTYTYMPQEVNHLQAAANAATQAAIAAGEEFIECADGKKRTPAEKQAWETHIWDQLRQVQG